MSDDCPEWYLDELAHAGAEHLDTAYVADYETKAGYDPAADLAVLVDHGLDHDSVVVDLGAGTGVFATAVAAHAGQVVAVDVSPAMVEQIERRVAAAGLDNVTVVHGGYLSYAHDGPPADFVFSRNALHQVPDFWKGIALDRTRRLLRSGGILRLRDLVYDFDPADADAALAEWFGGAVDDSTRGWTPSELAEHVRLEHSTYAWLFEPLLERCGFEILDKAYGRRAYAAYTCRRT